MTGPYQPPSDKPSDGGWSGGDINSPFGFGDATASPSQSHPPKSESQEPSPYQGVQYELETPAGPALPVQHPGYPPPGGSPGIAMSPPPMGPPGHPGAPYQSAPPPGYGPPPGPPVPPPGAMPFGQPTPSKNNGWLIGGIAAGLVLLLAVAVVIVVIANNTGDSNDSGNQGNVSDSDTDPGTDEGGNEGGDDQGGNEGGDDGADYGNGQYAPTAGLCDQIDMAKFIEQESSFDPFEETAYSTSVTCTANAQYGSVYLTADGYTDATSAAERFESTSDIWLTDKENIREVDGPWDQSKLGEGDVSGSDISMTMLIQAGNMVVLINFYNYGDGGSQSDGIDAAIDCMKQVMEIAAG